MSEQSQSPVERYYEILEQEAALLDEFQEAQDDYTAAVIAQKPASIVAGHLAIREMASEELGFVEAGLREVGVNPALHGRFYEPLQPLLGDIAKFTAPHRRLNVEQIREIRRGIFDSLPSETQNYMRRVRTGEYLRLIAGEVFEIEEIEAAPAVQPTTPPRQPAAPAAAPLHPIALDKAAGRPQPARMESEAADEPRAVEAATDLQLASSVDTAESAAEAEERREDLVLEYRSDIEAGAEQLTTIGNMTFFKTPLGEFLRVGDEGIDFPLPSQSFEGQMSYAEACRRALRYLFDKQGETTRVVTFWKEALGEMYSPSTQEAARLRIAVRSWLARLTYEDQPIVYDNNEHRRANALGIINFSVPRLTFSEELLQRESLHPHETEVSEAERMILEAETPETIVTPEFVEVPLFGNITRRDAVQLAALLTNRAQFLASVGLGTLTDEQADIIYELDRTYDLEHGIERRELSNGDIAKARLASVGKIMQMIDSGEIFNIPADSPLEPIALAMIGLDRTKRDMFFKIITANIEHSHYDNTTATVVPDRLVTPAGEILNPPNTRWVPSVTFDEEYDLFDEADGGEGDTEGGAFAEVLSVEPLEPYVETTEDTAGTLQEKIAADVVLPTEDEELRPKAKKGKSLTPGLQTAVDDVKEAYLDSKRLSLNGEPLPVLNNFFPWLTKRVVTEAIENNIIKKPAEYDGKVQLNTEAMIRIAMWHASPNDYHRKDLRRAVRDAVGAVENFIIDERYGDLDD